MILTLDNINEYKSGTKIVFFIKDNKLLILVRGPKNTFMFIPVRSSDEYKYKGKNALQSIKSAIANNEVVHMVENESEMIRVIKQ